MIANPYLGQHVGVHYAKNARHARPLHGKTGVVAIVSKGKPRNHGVLIDGVLYAIPCGNLIKLHSSPLPLSRNLRSSSH